VTILIQSILIFLIAKSYVFHCSFINIIAKSVFAFYILNYAYVFVDRSFIHVDNMSNEWYYIFAVLLESFIMVTSAFFIDQLIGKGVRIVLRRFCAKRST